MNEVARAVAGTGHGARHRAGRLRERSRRASWAFRGTRPRPLGVALGRRERVIDVGDVEGRLFVNVAGIGLDAQVAARFNARPAGRRGSGPTCGSARTRSSATAPGSTRSASATETWREEALVVVCANARQYGGGAVVAPTARLDDGQLDLVVVAPRPPLEALRDALHLFRGTLDRAPGVRTARACRRWRSRDRSRSSSTWTGRR